MITQQHTSAANQHVGHRTRRRCSAGLANAWLCAPVHIFCSLTPCVSKQGCDGRLRSLFRDTAPATMVTGQSTMQTWGQVPCMHQQQRPQQAQLQHSAQHLKRQHRHNTPRPNASKLSTRAVQTAERPTAAYPGGMRPSIEDRVSAFDGRGIAVVSPPLTDIKLPMLRDSKHKVFACHESPAIEI